MNLWGAEVYCDFSRIMSSRLRLIPVSTKIRSCYFSANILIILHTCLPRIKMLWFHRMSFFSCCFRNILLFQVKKYAPEYMNNSYKKSRRIVEKGRFLCNHEPPKNPENTLKTPFPGCLRLGLSWFNWWVSFAQEFQCCYFCESS